MTVLLILTVGALCIVCFYFGAKVGQQVSKGESLELPNINPIEKIRETLDKREAKKEQDRIETIMQNVERYNGTSEGQTEVPKG